MISVPFSFPISLSPKKNRIKHKFGQFKVQSWFSDIKFSDNLWFSDLWIYYIKSFDLATGFAETKSVTKSRLHCEFGQRTVQSWFSDTKFSDNLWFSKDHLSIY